MAAFARAVKLLMHLACLAHFEVVLYGGVNYMVRNYGGGILQPVSKTLTARVIQRPIAGAAAKGT
jgi:TRAP-type C4-dicarboxylate transport system permease small subunit